MKAKEICSQSYHTYIFDLYGTLINIHTDEHAARTWKTWCKSLDRQQIRHPAYYRFREDFFRKDLEYRKARLASGLCQCAEIDVIDVYRDLFAAYGNGILPDDLLAELSYSFRLASRDYIRLFPGVPEYLKQLREEGKQVFILSNAQRSYTWPEICMFHLDTLTDDQLISSDYGCMKPDTGFFEILFKKHAIDRSSALMHGDSLTSDIAGADAAGIASVHLAGANAPERYYLDQLRG